MVQNSKAWELLKEDERLALTLKHGHGKSTWEAGEIMDKAHYKFLEIEARAKKFMRLFTEHLDIYGKIIPDLKLEDRFRKYMYLTIEKRKTVTEAIYEVGDPLFSMLSFREKIIIEELERLLKSEKTELRNFALLVLEFDRWNNFRILPRSIQEPSAFKRRNKKNDIKNIKNILEMNPFVVEKLHEKYKAPKDYSGRFLYIPLPGVGVKDEEAIMVAKFSEKTINTFSNLGIHVFSRKEHAEEFLSLLIDYRSGRLKRPKEGLRFWPKFRISGKNALNYNSLQKKIASRKYLESALKDLDIILAKGYKKE